MDEIHRRRQLRRLQEKRRRAGIRRRRALICAALASAVAGAVVGAGAGGSSLSGTGVALARGGLGAPPDEDGLVHSRKPIPILMYHVIASAPATAANPELFVKPIRFRAEMDELAKRGFQAITLEQAYAAWKRGGEVPRKPVVISFDDGYRGDYEDAMPTLRGHRWPGVLDLELGSIESGELTNAMVDQMLDAGWELASHTISHVDLTTMRGSDLRREVAGSRAVLRKRFRVPVDFFCYPAGRFDAKTVTAVRRAGYLGATTTEEGLGSRTQMFKLRRIRVDGSDGVAGMERKLRAAGV